MRNKTILLFLLIFLILFFFFQRFTPCKNKEAILYKLKNKNYCLLVADTTYKRTNGLMNYKKPINFDGIIFIFPKKEIQTFWNMNTYLDLDIYWLNDNKIVGKSSLSSIEKTKDVVYVSSPKQANKVIEIVK